jgi:uracil-DNA glycosylase family 4
MVTPADRQRQLSDLNGEVVACRRCPRLVEWREGAAARRPAAAQEEEYWARPLPGFGDPEAMLLVVGLAPAANGGNRTGRMFTGDRSGDFLYAALHRAGYANQPQSVSRDDGLELLGAYVTAAVRCAPPDNKPTPGERDSCLPYLSAEIALLSRARVVLALGAFAYEAAYRLCEKGAGARRRPRFAHGLEVPLAGGRTLVCSYHPSQRNVFTGLLDAAMVDRVLERVADLGAPAPLPGGICDPGSSWNPDRQGTGPTPA